MNSRKQQLSAFNSLLDIMDELREKCPWDKKQTLESLRHLTIEETYELADAILDNDLARSEKRIGRPVAPHCFLRKNWFRDQGV